MAERNYKIYKLLFPGGEVYIGKTRQTMSRRFRNNGTGYSKMSNIWSAIQKYGWDNVEKIILHENLTEDESNKLEKEEIENHGGIDNPLVLNSQSGGSNGFINSEEIKEKISKTKKMQYKEHPELLENLYIKIDQYSYDGSTLIATYNSLLEASEKTGIISSNISACLNGIYLSAGGYRWIRHNKYFGIIEYPSYRIAVNQIDKISGEIIATYGSMIDAYNATGINHCNISKCINGKLLSTGGFKWERAAAIYNNGGLIYG